MTKAELARRLAWRFKVIQQASERSRNIARTCRHFGISRQAFYRWKRRFDAYGAAGLSDRPSTPHRSPKATSREVVSKILHLRQTYHFGPGKIADYLTRFHQQSLAVSSVHRILVRHGLNQLPHNQKHRSFAKRWQRYEKPQPGHRLRREVSRADPRHPEAALSLPGHRRLHPEGLDIRHVYIRPRTPHLNGKVERSHRVDDQEFYQLLDKDGITDDIHLFNDKLREWENYYNYHRPHGALDGQTPYERLIAKMRSGTSPAS